MTWTFKSHHHLFVNAGSGKDSEAYVCTTSDIVMSFGVNEYGVVSMTREAFDIKTQR